MATVTKPQTRIESKGFVHCPICTHTVEAIVVLQNRTAKVKPGQKCSRCQATLDAAYVLRLDQAA
ncbi:MAG: hypothetical protein ACK5AZ_16810 [Bryobacteraceae bacterium]